VIMMHNNGIRKMAIAATLIMAVIFTGCVNNTDQAEEESAEMKVTSENLHDGVWDEIITNTSAGENRSPELTWSAVDGAEEYAVYMIDPDGHNWLHWRVTGFTGTHLDEGETPANSEYVGPYPPSGTHRYIVTVYALKAAPDTVPGNFDSSNSGTDKIEEALDTSGGSKGNIITTGVLEGTYTAR